jgi:hypothetical protein
MRIGNVATASMLALALSAPTFAQGTPSSKATAAVNTLVKCTMSTATTNDGTAVLPTSCVDLWSGATVATENEWIPVMTTTVKLSNSQSVFVSPSLVTGLYTQTRTKTTTGSTSTAQAMGGVYMRAVLVDANGIETLAAPLNLCNGNTFGCANVAGDWGVVLDSRIQTLSQSLSDCTVVTTGGTGTCSFTSIIDFVLQTASAHTFNLIFANVGVGVYTLRIDAAVASAASVIGSGSAVGSAAFGLGSVTAESVRLVKDFSF